MSEGLRERVREREGRHYKESYSPCTFREILSRMRSVERKILQSIPGVWGRGLTPARMRTNSSCMAMMLIWVSHTVWNGNRENGAGWGGCPDGHAYVNMGLAGRLQASEAQIMGSWARRLLRLRVRAALLSGLILAHVLGQKLHNLSQLHRFVQRWFKDLMTLINGKRSSQRIILFLARAELIEFLIKRLVRTGLMIV